MILVWIGALIVGITLGVLGSGGAILTVPILTYLVGQETKLAIAGSLIIVGIISIFAAIPYARQKLVKWRIVILFGIPGMAGAVFGAWLALFVSDALQMLIFSILLLLAAYLMYKPIKLKGSEKERAERSALKTALEGLLVGVVTGLVGVGGGFLIIPALVLLGGLSMHLAVGTSLVIITMNSFAGFYGYLSVLDRLSLTLDWSIIIVFSIIGVIGGWIGHKISGKLNQEYLKKGFSIFLVLIGVFILYENLPSLFLDISS